MAKDSHPILVYSVPDGVHQYTLMGHYNILYDLKWYKHSLLSASSGNVNLPANLSELEICQSHGLTTHQHGAQTLKYLITILTLRINFTW